MKPISPEDIPEAKAAIIPDNVIKVWNDNIALNYSSGRSVIKQSDIVDKLQSAMNCDRQYVFAASWLNIEEIYRKAGWKVVYDKPGFNESYAATFTFIKDKRH